MIKYRLFKAETSSGEIVTMLYRHYKRSLKPKQSIIVAIGHDGLCARDKLYGAEERNKTAIIANLIKALNSELRLWGGFH